MGREAPRKRLACRVMCRPNGCSAEHPNVFGAPPTPRCGVRCPPSPRLWRATHLPAEASRRRVKQRCKARAQKMRRGNEEVCVCLRSRDRGWKIPNLQKNRKIQETDQPARAAAKEAIVQNGAYGQNLLLPRHARA